MAEMRVTTFRVDAEGRPVIPGASIVTREGDTRHFTAYFLEGRRPVGSISACALADPAVYGAAGAGRFAHVGTGRVPVIGGVVWSDFAQSRAGRDVEHWRCTGTIQYLDDQGATKQRTLDGEVVRLQRRAPDMDPDDANPWAFDGLNVTRAEPALPSACGAIRDEHFGGVSPRAIRDRQQRDGAQRARGTRS